MKRNYFVIKVDYYCYNADTDEEFTMPLYLYTMRNKHRTYVFEEKLGAEHYDLKWFQTREDAELYLASKGWNTEPQCSFENARVEEIEY